jgi:K+-transporting ATPase KdpF subunit
MNHSRLPRLARPDLNLSKSRWRFKGHRYLFLALCLNLVLAPAVWAASSDLSRSQAYWLGGLGLMTLALSIYLFVVMFAPEKFS